MQKRIFTSESYALDWAKDHLNFDSSRLVSRAPWERTYSLSGRNGRAYLRLFPPAMSSSPTTTAVLAQRFPNVLPEVISNDDELGLLLLRRGQGRRLDNSASEEQQRALLRAYGDMQAEVRSQQDLLELFPTLELNTLIPGLLAFLDPAGPRDDSQGKIGAVYFLGRTRTRRYHDPLSKRIKLLEKTVLAAQRLPATLNHGNLRLKNATLAPGNAIILENWDDATVGPAGLSLHALFGGCAAPESLLSGIPVPGNSKSRAKYRYVLDAYIDALVDGGYAARSELVNCLPGAICAGTIQQIVRYADYPSDSRTYRRRTRRVLTNMLGDLLDYCDALALRDRDLAIASALDYRKNARARRAESILRRCMAANRNDPQVCAQLAMILHERGKHREALSAYRDAVELNPGSADLHNRYGVALLEKLRLDDAITIFRKGLALDPAHTGLAGNLDRACELRDCSRHARQSDAVPTLPVSDTERDSGKPGRATLTMGARLFDKYGTLLVHNAFDKDLIRACDEHVRNNLGEFLEGAVATEALPRGDKRFQFATTLAGPLSNPGLYGNPVALALMKKLLGPEFLLGSTTCIAALGGAKYQKTHKDHAALFTSDSGRRAVPEPPFAIATLVPLVALHELNGTIAVRKGSHLKSSSESAKLPRQSVTVPVGSCLLMDRRLSYASLKNKTDAVSPILSMVYQRPWFVDTAALSVQPPLRIPDGAFEKIPRHLRHLFQWDSLLNPDI